MTSMENIEGKNRPVATNFQFLKMLCPSVTALLQRSRVFEVALVGAWPLHLATARPSCHLKSPPGTSLLRKRGFTVFAIVMLHLQILQEEKYLTHTFGTAYTDYCRKVHRYL